MRTPALVTSPLSMIVPWLLWGAHLLFVYVVLAVGCAAMPEAAAAVLPTLWLATAVVVVLLAMTGYAQYRQCRAVPAGAGKALKARSLALEAGPIITLLALVAVLWTALPLLFIAPCS